MELYEIIKMVKGFRGKNETNKTFHELLQDPNELFLVRKKDNPKGTPKGEQIKRKTEEMVVNESWNKFRALLNQIGDLTTNIGLFTEFTEKKPSSEKNPTNLFNIIKNIQVVINPEENNTINGIFMDKPEVRLDEGVYLKGHSSQEFAKMDLANPKVDVIKSLIHMK